MLRTKVKISHINNLTDARYFAAMGVEYLGFCCNPDTEKYCPVSKMNEIRNWVEGPEFVLELDGWQSESEIHDIVNTGLGQALHFGAFATYSGKFSLPVFKDFIPGNIGESDFSACDYPVIRSEKPFGTLSPSEIAIIQKLMSSDYYFIDIPFETEETEKVLSNFEGAGLILRGGDEEKTGFKSFEQFDKIFEILELIED
ncbi:MAG: hypothetical protein WBP08_11695 [Saprospiraceae bacterium]